MRRGSFIWGAFALGWVLVAMNASWLAPRAPGPARWVAHRGVHQTFPLEGVDGDTCTATRIRPPEHHFLENTLDSMTMAFAYQASAVEIDVHATADGHLAIIHDHDLACRTDGRGRPEDHLLAELKALDVGHGYTADGGRTFPLRGRVGGLVSLDEVFRALPGRRFVIDVKSGSAEDGDRVADLLATLPAEDRRRQIVYGGAAADQVRARLPEVTTFSRGRIKSCLLRYLAVGWLGIVPEACRETWVLVPVDRAWMLWGYPRRLEARLRGVGSELVLMGPLIDGNTTGVDDEDLMALVPPDFGGWVWTNRIELRTVAGAAPTSK